MPRIIIGALCAVLVACGGSPNPATTESDQDNAQNTARTKLMQCVRDQGVDISSAADRNSLSEADQQKLQEAMQGPCAKYMQDAFGTTHPGSDPAFQDALTKFRACMRDNGVEVGNGVAAMHVDTDDPKVAAAMDKCRDQLPQRLQGAGGR